MAAQSGIVVDPSEVHSITVDPSEVTAVTEQTPWQKFTSTLGQGNLAQMGRFALDLAQSWDPEARQRARDFISGSAGALAQEPGRVISELGAASNAKTGEELRQHLSRAMPLVGPQWDKIQHQIDQGAYAEATGNFVDMLGQVVGPELASQYGPAILRTAAQTGERVAKLPGDIALRIPPQVAERIGRVSGGTTGAAVGHATGIPGAGLAGAVVGKEAGAGLGGALSRLQADIQFDRAIKARQNWPAGAAEPTPVSPEYQALLARTQAPAQTPYPAATPESTPAAAETPAPEPPTPDYEAIMRARIEAERAAAPPPAAASEAAADARSLNDAAQFVGKKPFDQLTPMQQELARKIAAADKAARQAPPGATPYPGAAPAVNTPSIAQEAPPGAAAPPPEPTAAPPPTPPRTVEELSNAINASLAREPAPLPKATEAPAETPTPQAQARATRAERATKFADYLEGKGITADMVGAMKDREQLRLIAQDAGVDIPKSKDAFAKLRDAIAEEMRGRAARPAPAATPYPQPSWFNPSAIQRLIDLQERRAGAAR